jgi:hypothetical protein
MIDHVKQDSEVRSPQTCVLNKLLSSGRPIAKNIVSELSAIGERQALAYLANYIYKNEYGTNWSLAADIAGYFFDMTEHPRLTKAQYFHDDDYPTAILHFLEEVYEDDIESFKTLVAFILDQKLPDDQNLRAALSTLGVISGDPTAFSATLAITIPVRLVDIDTFPDDFYSELVHLINKAYQAGAYGAVPILIRKLMENLLVDILRSYYGMRDVTMFFDKGRGRFHDFGMLLEKASERLNDFDWCKDLMNKELLAKLEKYRERGNASAHSIVVAVRKEGLDQTSDEVTQITKQLFKLWSVIVTAPKMEIGNEMPPKG